MPNEPTYKHHMSERETLPPSAGEAEGVAQFEAITKRESDFWAMVRHAAALAGVGKK